VAGTSPTDRTVDALSAIYDEGFFEELDAAVGASAKVIVPIVCSLLGGPTSVLDIGCGRGTWLRVFQDHGVGDIFGVDGPHVLSALEIPPSKFRAQDLTAPLDIGRRFDLVVSLEVGEHLPPGFADAFVASLVAHGSAVLFSAAIPFQGGPGHVNEAWQSSWATRFAAHGYAPIDEIRPAVWNHDDVAFWYAQNTILYVDTDVHASLVASYGPVRPLDLVHPRLLERTNATLIPRPPPPSLSRLVRQLPGATQRAVGQRLRKRGASGG
jgi:SAM-dependent methyltransferase